MENFEKIKLIGRGAHGTVYLSKQKTDNKLVILKEIPVDQMSLEERQISLNEAKVLKMLHHPNIVAYYENFLEEKTMTIVMEYVQGGTLFDFLQERNGKLLSEKDVLHYFGQMVYTLQHVHGKSILHRDLKSQNILLNQKKDILKIGDFGISKILSSKSKAYTVVGTPCYISPELCEGRSYNQKSDIWALGCLLYELMTLRRPFDASTLPALVMKIMKGSFEPVSDMYSSELKDNILSKMLHLDPNQRPTAAQLMCHPLLIRVIFNLYMSIGSIPYTKKQKLSVVESIRPLSVATEKLTVPDPHVLCGSTTTEDSKNWDVLFYEAKSDSVLSLPPPSTSRIKSVSLGNTHKVGFTESGLLVGWREIPKVLVNSESDMSESDRPMSISYFIDERVALNIIQVVCGLDFTACLSDNGVVFTFGKVSSGCLGFNSNEDTDQPRVLESIFNHDIISLACGRRHILALSDEHVLFSWGYGKEGCLGLREIEHQIYPRVVPLPSEVVPCKIFCGVDTSFFITQASSLYACGNNRHNRLGLDCFESRNQIDEAQIFTAVMSEPLPTLKVQAATSGKTHSVILTESGELFSMGSNTFGQLGWGENNLFYSMPQKIKIEAVSFSSIACGDFFTVAVSSDNVLYCWGKGPKSLMLEETLDIFDCENEIYRLKKQVHKVSCNTEDCIVMVMEKLLMSI